MEGKVNDAETGSWTQKREKRSLLSDKDKLQICFAALLLIYSTVILTSTLLEMAWLDRQKGHCSFYQQKKQLTTHSFVVS